MRNENFNEIYTPYGQIGKGGSGKVYEVKCRLTGESYACKVLSKKKYKEEKILQEIELLSEMNHDNIIKYRESFETKSDIFVIMTHAKGGELYTVLHDNGKFSERNAKNVIGPLLDAIAYLHKKNIMHRDIKLENILFANPVLYDSRSKDIEVRSQDVLLVDFGLSQKLSNSEPKPDKICGSNFYVAPEVYNRVGYGLEIDLWGVGVVTFMLLSNTPPFYGHRKGELEEAVRTGSYSFENSAFRGVSEEAKDFIRRLLTLNPARRLDAEAALSHIWLHS